MKLIPPSWLKTFKPGQVGGPEDRAEVGERGRHIATLCQLGLPTPPAIVLTRALFDQARRAGRLPRDLRFILGETLDSFQPSMGRFGSSDRPMLLDLTAESVHGEVTTFRGIGLNHRTVEGLIRRTGNPRFSWELYRRLIADFGEALYAIDPEVFDRIVTQQRREDGFPTTTSLDSDALRQVVRRSLWAFEARCGCPFPTEPREQLEHVIRGLTETDADAEARAGSRARPASIAAIAIQSMVFGNTGARSGSGIAYTRNPVSGGDDVAVDFLFNGDVEELGYHERAPEIGRQAPVDLPWVQHVLEIVNSHIEGHFDDMQEMLFVVEDGSLYVMHSSAGRRSPAAALKIAVRMVKQGKISQRQGLKHLAGTVPDQLRVDHTLANPEIAPLSRFKPTSPGAATGQLALSSAAALRFHRSGLPVVLAYDELNSDDLRGIGIARAVIAIGGGLSSRVAAMARQMGCPSAVTRGDLAIDHNHKRARIGATLLPEGEIMTVCGNTGDVFRGAVPILPGQLPQELEVVRRWTLEEADEHHTLA